MSFPSLSSLFTLVVQLEKEAKTKFPAERMSAGCQGILVEYAQYLGLTLPQESSPGSASYVSEWTLRAEM